MKKEIITITENGAVVAPKEARMSIAEIANLFDIFYQTAKSNIRAIQKSGVADGDYSMSCIAEGMKVYPDYYGLDMVTAVAFRVQSAEAKIFRNWLIRRATQNSTQTVYTLLTRNSMLN